MFRITAYALAAILAAAAYLPLSGGNVATQRAFVMVACLFGAVLAQGATHEIQADEAVQRAYLGATT